MIFDGGGSSLIEVNMTSRNYQVPKLIFVQN